MDSFDSRNSPAPESTDAAGNTAPNKPDEIIIQLDYGFTKKVVQRRTGSSAGKYDVYIYSPKNKKLRSKRELKDFLMTYYPNIPSTTFDDAWLFHSSSKYTPNQKSPFPTFKTKETIDSGGGKASSHLNVGPSSSTKIMPLKIWPQKASPEKITLAKKPSGSHSKAPFSNGINAPRLSLNNGTRPKKHLAQKLKVVKAKEASSINETKSKEEKVQKPSLKHTSKKETKAKGPTSGNEAKSKEHTVQRLSLKLASNKETKNKDERLAGPRLAHAGRPPKEYVRYLRKNIVPMFAQARFKHMASRGQTPSSPHYENAPSSHMKSPSPRHAKKNEDGNKYGGILPPLKECKIVLTSIKPQV